VTQHNPNDFGGSLKATRERAGLSLRQIADATKHSVTAFDALEKNRIAQLPGGIYRRAIVRAYAAHVGLDPEQTLRAFLVLHPDDVPTATLLDATVAAPRRSALRSLFGIVGALIPIAAGGFYFVSHVRGADARPAAAPPSPAPIETVADASLATYVQSPVMVMLSVSARTELAIAAGERRVLARVVEPGETLYVELGTDLTLVGSDAGAVHLSINGRAGRTLGAAGTPLDVRIDRESYQDWLLQTR
jgi:hypothetical protein